MRVKLNMRLPSLAALAYSGGSDSTFALDFLGRTKRIAYLLVGDHGTETSRLGILAAYKAANRYGVDVRVFRVEGDSEATWGRSRFEVCQRQSLPVITAHHFDDALEWWIYTSLRGHPRVMPKVNGNILRPFLRAEKSVITEWLLRNKLEYVDDPSNHDGSNMRSKLRALLPALESAVPAMRAALRKRMEEDGYEGEGELQEGADEEGFEEEPADEEPGADEAPADDDDGLADDDLADDEEEGDEYADPNE